MNVLPPISVTVSGGSRRLDSMVVSTVGSPKPEERSHLEANTSDICIGLNCMD
ncbi:stromal membrane-associated protein [Aspergillus luchuensis]|uniref:Stromal membrane-associated protein n=1 Tax=Aspergillus kawachii TaxID=1069201 RepID=A0A146FPA0_ASPKA|nr:stromal membrane-associated protein [Aspergillus luchuensis]